MSHHWDVEADVVVVGFGAAGMAASVTAHDLGAKVVILEKAPEGQEGGNTRVAGQGYLNTSSADRRSPISPRCAAPTPCRSHGEGLGGGDVPEQCMARKPRRRSAGASASAGRHRISGSARLGLRAQIPRRPDLWLFLHLETVRAPGQATPDPDPLRDAGAGTDPARHHQGNPRGARPARRRVDLRQGAQGRGADLRRVREQPGDDPQLPARRAVLLHLRHAVQRRRRHHDGDVGRRRSLAHEQLRRALDGAEGAGGPDVVFDAGVALQQGDPGRHDRGRPGCAGASPTKNTRPGTAKSRSMAAGCRYRRRARCS